MIKIQPKIYSIQNNNQQSFKAIQYTDMAQIALTFEKGKVSIYRLEAIQKKLRALEESQKDNAVDILLDFGKIKNSTEQHFFAVVNKRVYTSVHNFWGQEYINVIKKAIKKAAYK